MEGFIENIVFAVIYLDKGAESLGADKLPGSIGRKEF
jgi:hypothetical protein